MSKYPKLLGNACTADKENDYVISSDGKMYKCWSDIGIDELSIGNILDRSSRCNRLLEYLLYDPTKDEKCSACKLLPICMGGCPHDRLSKIKDRCIVYTDILMKHLRSIASIIQRENAKQNKRISYLKTWR